MGWKHLVEAKLKEKYDDSKKAIAPSPQYQVEIPEGNNGLGLLLLGITGDRSFARQMCTTQSQSLSAVRGTVQADILKEDQAQNTCIFSTSSAAGDGRCAGIFHPEQGAQFLLGVHFGLPHRRGGRQPDFAVGLHAANGFTFVEYYRSRGMNVDDFAPNLSFFFPTASTRNTR
jgi:methylmalonyl-CoA mutase